MIGRVLKGAGVTIIAGLLATVSIDAADNLGNFKHSLLGAAVFGVIGEPAPCPDDMVFVDSPDGGFCIDRYEASAGEECPYPVPANQDETRLNLAAKGCVPQSVPDAVPWTNISQDQARLACARAGKRLPVSAEWFAASLGTPDRSRGWGRNDCNVSRNWLESEPGKTGSAPECVSAYGAYDMIGNVWEWMYETVTRGTYDGVALPDSGYVHAADERGIPIETSRQPDANYFDDRFWVDTSQVTGIFRGGFWGSGADAGVYAMHTQVRPSFVGEAIGFRCVK